MLRGSRCCTGSAAVEDRAEGGEGQRPVLPVRLMAGMCRELTELWAVSALRRYGQGPEQKLA